MIELEIRKIQRTVSGSFFITLPKTWVTELEMDKGTELKMVPEQDGSLRIYPLKNQAKINHDYIIEIEKYSEPNSLERCINNCYIQGADVITILSKGTILSNKKRLIKETASNLVGSEISEEFSNRLTIRILVDPVKFPLANLIKRIYTLVSSMHVDAMKSFQNCDEILAEDVINREKEVSKLYFLMLRQLNLSLSFRLNIDDICTSAFKIDCVLGVILARELKKMANYAVNIAEQSIRFKDVKIEPELKEDLMKMSRFIIKIQQNSILAFFKNDFLRANKILNSAQQIIEYNSKMENKILKTIKDINTILYLITISRNLRNIASSAFSVAYELQTKHHPKVILEKQNGSEDLPEPILL